MNTSAAIPFLQSEFESLFFEGTPSPDFHKEMGGKLVTFFNSVLGLSEIDSIETLKNKVAHHWGQDFEENQTDAAPNSVADELTLELLAEEISEPRLNSKRGVTIGKSERKKIGWQLLGDSVLLEKAFFSIAFTTRFIQKNFGPFPSTPANPSSFTASPSPIQKSTEFPTANENIKNTGKKILKAIFFLPRAFAAAFPPLSPTLFKQWISHPAHALSVAGIAAILVTTLAIIIDKQGPSLPQPNGGMSGQTAISEKSQGKEHELSGKPKKLRWKFLPGTSVNLVKSGTVTKYLGSRILSKTFEKNIVNFVVEKTNNYAHCRGVFKTFKSSTERGTPILERTFESLFQIAPQGGYKVPNNTVQPTIRSIPSFPASEVAPGSKWVAPIEFFYWEMQPSFLLITNASYRYKRDLVYNGKPAAEIEISYSFNEDVRTQLGNYELHQLAWIIASNNLTLYWDYDAGVPLYIKENFFEKLHINSGDIYSYLMVFENNYDVTAPLAPTEEKKLEKDLNALVDKYKSVESREDETGYIIDLGEILFDFNSDVIKPDTSVILDEIALLLKRYNNYETVIEGHTDNVGNKNYNQQLSQRRATSVGNYLVNKQPDLKEKLYTKGYGMSMPKVSNESEEGRARNRRVAVKILKNGQ